MRGRVSEEKATARCGGKQRVYVDTAAGSLTVQKNALSRDICMLITQIELRDDFRIFSKYTPATPAQL